MIPSIPAILVIGLAACPSQAAAPRWAELTPGAECKREIRAAEQRYAIPAGLLFAISQVETGRPDPRSGVLQPWPWSINLEGKGAYLESQAEAVAAVRKAQASGTSSIDTGCLQVNLKQHPDAFATLDEAFDPHANTDYAARFLRTLFKETGDWTLAAGRYHSSTSDIAAPYRDAVVKQLGYSEPVPSGGDGLVQPPSRLQALSAAWAATLAPHADDADGRWSRVGGVSPARERNSHGPVTFGEMLTWPKNMPMERK